MSVYSLNHRYFSKILVSSPRFFSSSPSPPFSLVTVIIVLTDPDIHRGRIVLTIAADVLHPFGLAIHQNLVYWTDWVDNSVHRADKLTGKSREVLFRDLDHRPMDIHIYHRNRTRESKPPALLIILLTSVLDVSKGKLSHATNFIIAILWELCSQTKKKKKKKKV